jgi:hypothetical protein
MSAFIGPIHHWLYGKIRLVNEREEHIFTKAAAMCGPLAEELREMVWQTYGPPLPDADLGELIDHDNIHGWLQRQINLAETREAAFIKELLDTCGEPAAELLDKAFGEHGRATGEAARAGGRYDTATAPGIYKAINDHYLNGMPCDQADQVVNSQADSVVWQSESCLQAPNWRRAGVSAAAMKKYYKVWLTAFVDGLNPEFVYQQSPADRGADDTATRCEIHRSQSPVY